MVRKSGPPKAQTEMAVDWQLSDDRMGAGCCISELFVFWRGRANPDDGGELELTLLGVFACICPSSDLAPNGCISIVLKKDQKSAVAWCFNYHDGIDLQKLKCESFTTLLAFTLMDAALRKNSTDLLLLLFLSIKNWVIF